MHCTYVCIASIGCAAVDLQSSSLGLAGVGLGLIGWRSDNPTGQPSKKTCIASVFNLQRVVHCNNVCIAMVSALRFCLCSGLLANLKLRYRERWIGGGLGEGMK